MPLVRPPMTATSALLRGTRSGNTPCAMTTYKHSEKRSEEGFQGITSRYSKSSNSRMDSALFCVSNSKYVQWTGFAETTNLLYRPVETNLRKSKGSLFDFSFFFYKQDETKSVPPFEFVSALWDCLNFFCLKLGRFEIYQPFFSNTIRIFDVIYDVGCVPRKILRYK